MSAWVGLLRGHAALTRALNADLVSDHGLTLNDYEVLLHLSRAPERKLRRVDLAEQVLLTASGVTRLLDGLQASGYVDKAACPSDARVTYAVLTAAGLDKLRSAAVVHVAGIRAKFAERYSDEELVTLAELLARLDGSEPDGEACTPDGTAARPCAPDARTASTSTVGFPRESRISWPWSESIALTGPDDIGAPAAPKGETGRAGASNLA